MWDSWSCGDVGSGLLAEVPLQQARMGLHYPGELLNLQDKGGVEGNVVISLVFRIEPCEPGALCLQLTRPSPLWQRCYNPRPCLKTKTGQVWCGPAQLATSLFGRPCEA